MKATETEVCSALGCAVANYVGGRVLYLETVADPSVEDTHAVRATVKNDAGNPHDLFFLVVRTPLARVTVEELEEVEFTDWPPTLRGER